MRKQLIAKIHIAKKELVLDDETYRQALQGVTGKASCAGMSNAELERVLAHFKQLGWRPSRAAGRRYSPKSRDRQTHDQVDVIRAIWIDMYQAGAIDNGSEAALDVWVKRTTSRLNKGAGVARTEWLRGNHHRLATKVLESLKQWQARIQVQWKNEDLRRISQEQQRTDQHQTVVIRQLLEAGGIFWWPLFGELGIEYQEGYCRDRRQLL